MSYGGYGGYGDGDGGYGDGGYGGYGGGGGGGGGGYMQDMGSSQGSSSSPSKTPQAKVDTLTPVTVRMINASEETPEGGNLVIHGRKVGRIVLVAKVMDLTVKDSSVSFTFDDGTGVVSGAWWNGDSGPPDVERFEQGMYVQVFGSVRVFNSRKTLTIFTVKPVTDHNQLTHHFLDTIFTFLQVTCGPVNPALKNDQQQSFSNHFQQQQGNSSFNMYGGEPQAMEMSGGMGQPIASGGGDNGSLKHQVMAIFNKPEVEDLESGFSVQDTFEELRRQGVNATESMVRKCINLLSEDGHLYSTIDEEHFKSTGDALS